MKLPFVFIGAVCIGASFLLPLLGSLFSALLILAAAVFIVCTIPKDRRIISRVVLTLLLLFLVGVRFVATELYISHKNDRLVPLDGSIEAIVTYVSFNERTSRFDLKIIDSSEEEAIGLNCSGYMFGRVGFSPGDRINAMVSFKENDDRYKISDFDNGKYFSLQVKEYYVAEKAADVFYSFIHNVRRQTLKAVNSLGADREADLLGAVIIGDRHSVSIDLNTDVKATGASHMLVVSGLHLGIMCGLLMRILKARLSRVATVLILTSFVLLVVVICLFHISILRAGISYIIMLLGMIIFRDKDPLNSLGLATVFLTLLFPYIFYNIAFMLSASATFAVIGPSNSILETFPFYKKGKPLYKRLLRNVFETFTIAVCALILTLPITVYYFGATSLIAPISNLLLNLSVTGILAFGIIGVIFWAVPIIGKVLSIPFIFIARLFAKYFLSVIDFLADSGLGFLDISPDKSIYCGIFTVVFILAVHFICKSINSKKEIRPFAYRQNPEIGP